MRQFVTILSLLMVMGAVREAAAQAIDGPPGSIGGIFGGRRPVNPNRNSQSLDLSIDVSGGYDHDPGAVLQVPDGVPDPSEVGWYAGNVTASTNYRVGHTRRALEARGRGLVNYQDNRPDMLTGGDAGVNGVMRFGRQNYSQLSMALNASYEPSWVFGAATPTLPGDDAQTPAPPSFPLGVTEDRWLVLSAASGYTHRWNTRNETIIRAGGGRIRASTDAGSNSEWIDAAAEHTLTLRRNLGVIAAFSHNRSIQIEENQPAVPVQYQTLSGGAAIGWQLSPRRRVTASVTAGATQVTDRVGGAGNSLHPAYSMEIDYFGSTRWSTALHASRAVSVLEGISPLPVTTDTVELNFSASFLRRLRIHVSGSYINGADPGTEGRPGSRTSGAGATADLRYGLGRRFGAFASYNYYQHRIEMVQSALPPAYDRHTARVGFTYWLPLYGSF